MIHQRSALLLDHGAIVDNADSIAITADDKRDLTGFTGQIAGGFVAGGASFVAINVENDVEGIIETNAYIGNGVKIGQDVNFNGSVKNIRVEARPDITVNAEASASRREL